MVPRQRNIQNNDCLNLYHLAITCTGEIRTIYVVAYANTENVNMSYIAQTNMTRCQHKDPRLR